MILDELYLVVFEAIHRAEAYEDLGAPGTALAYREVSQLEEAIAKNVAPTEMEGRVARRGAVRAAVKSGQIERARRLAEQYKSQSGVDLALKRELDEIVGA